MSNTALLIKYLIAEARADDLYRKDGKWHVDCCCCDDCKIVEQWLSLSWFKRLVAKLSFIRKWRLTYE